MKKFELDLSTETQFSGRKFFRIKALTTFNNVEKGDLGGFVEKEENLSQESNAWVYGNALVCGNAKVCDNARVCGNAKVYGNAKVGGNAWVYGNAKVGGNAKVYGNSWVCGNTRVYGNAKMDGNAKLYSNADFVWFSNIGSEYGTLTVFKSKNEGEILITQGCFLGTVEQFLEKSKKAHDDKTRIEYELLIKVAQSRLGVIDITNS